MLAALFGLLAFLVAIGIHYEALVFASFAARRLNVPHRLRVAVAVMVAVAAHLTEVVAFAVGWLFVVRFAGGELSLPSPGFVDLIYFSGNTYTSLGFGDIVPVGAGRLLAVLESVTGLVLITWTASFTFLQMRENWNN